MLLQGGHELHVRQLSIYFPQVLLSMTESGFKDFPNLTYGFHGSFTNRVEEGGSRYSGNEKVLPSSLWTNSFFTEEVYFHLPKFHSIFNERITLVDCISFKVNMSHHILQDLWKIMVTSQSHDHFWALVE